MFGSKREEDPSLDEANYLEERLKRAALVSSRFPSGIDFKDKDVIDIGSGLGAFSIYAARQGARSVLGIDPDPESVIAAQGLLHRLAPDVSDKIRFRNIELERLDAGEFDLAVSMAVFEHIEDPTSNLRALHRHLRNGATVFLGIGPLYRAPWGDHRRTEAPLQMIFPWAHLAFSEKWLIARRNKRHLEHPVSTIRGLGLNCLRLNDYYASFADSGLGVKWIETNVTENLHISKLLRLCMHLPGCRELFAVNLYAILSKEQASETT